MLGASYGGAGFNGAATYGSPMAPTDLGSGGGYSANGGGAIQLTVDGLLQVDGHVGADAPFDASGLGAGSGGSLYVVAQALAGGGAITARGGSSYSTTHVYGAGGGGGRIALYFQTNDFTGQVQACGGSGQGTGAPSGWGGPGTIYTQRGQRPASC